MPMSENKPPMHIVAVAGLVSNPQGQVLMLKSPRYQDWEFPGGQVEESETLTHALEREVFEETGITASPISLVGVYSNTRTPSILILDFLCQYISGEPRTSLESTQVEWMDRDDALSRVERTVIRKRLKNMLEFSGQIIYQAYFVDPNRIDLGYKELEDRKI
jgi:8-oxo-dGTP diphosphatase